MMIFRQLFENEAEKEQGEGTRAERGDRRSSLSGGVHDDGV